MRLGQGRDAPILLSILSCVTTLKPRAFFLLPSFYFLFFILRFSVRQRVRYTIVGDFCDLSGQLLSFRLRPGESQCGKDEDEKQQHANMDSPQPRLVCLADGHRVDAVCRTRYHLPGLHHRARVHAVVLLEREIAHLPSFTPDHSIAQCRCTAVVMMSEKALSARVCPVKYAVRAAGERGTYYCLLNVSGPHKFHASIMR